jgi:hypothetical protein
VRSVRRGIRLVIFLSAAIVTGAACAENGGGNAEVFAKLPQSVGNIAFTPDNQLIFSHHPFFSPDVRVARLTSPTTFEPFPNAEWNTPRKGTDQYLDNVLGLRSDESGVVWIIDMGFRTQITPKLVGWNTRTNRLERIHYMPEPVTVKGSQPQDIVIDQKNRKFYIADENIGPGGDGSHAAIIVIDMDTGAARRVLDGDRSTVPENVPITVDGNDLTVPGKDGKPSLIKVGCDGITMDARSEWVYFAPLSGRSLYRIKATDLGNEKAARRRAERAGGTLLGQTEQWRPVDRLCGQHLPDCGRDQIDWSHRSRPEVSHLFERSGHGVAGRDYCLSRRVHVRVRVSGLRSRHVPWRQGRKQDAVSDLSVQADRGRLYLTLTAGATTPARAAGVENCLSALRSWRWRSPAA